MGKHRGNNGDKPPGPFGPGPHPTPEQSKKKADEFDRQYDTNREKGKGK